MLIHFSLFLRGDHLFDLKLLFSWQWLLYCSWMTLKACMAPTVVCDEALIFGVFTMTGVPKPDMTHSFLKSIWNSASSIKTQFSVKSKSASFHCLNYSYLVYKLPAELLTSGSNVFFLIVISMLFLKWWLGCVLKIEKQINCLDKLLIIPSI